ncbi:hypothetical protein QR685DRAFT_449406 [Neurospora intermedia]|uniref:Uncharacterized protein n=1 Tax=Neurospora intermedia TaxID=5142 RepID=A0ABR3D391_NEUIN
MLISNVDSSRIPCSNCEGTGQRSRHDCDNYRMVSAVTNTKQHQREYTTTQQPRIIEPGDCSI